MLSCLLRDVLLCVSKFHPNKRRHTVSFDNLDEIDDIDDDVATADDDDDDGIAPEAAETSDKCKKTSVL